MISSLKNKKGTFLPEDFYLGHELSFFIHDIMAGILFYGEKGNFFTHSIQINSNIKELKNKENIFSWLEDNNLLKDRSQLLKTVVLPAILSDMLNCIYECLETSRKGKLNVSYMLIRKPLQENLYLLEEIILNEFNFSEKLVNESIKLDSKNAGGIEKHKERIEKVINTINKEIFFDSSYIAELRYDKTKEDSFDGICNHAMHLFTSHKSIKTENLNINFIFSDFDSKITQWTYLYTRLPYLLFYILQIVEYITASIVLTNQEYLDETQRKISALIILCYKEINQTYKNEYLEKFLDQTINWLNSHCLLNGYKTPAEKDLIRMYKKGAYPKEKEKSIKERINRYQQIYLDNNLKNGIK
ncbi:hypothetical protein [Aliarcobacter butzleri]|uniref:hypothetical protein n=1 Tax=Aliarcobacter butzleri TaxID=28197 RepID=UPI003B217264